MTITSTAVKTDWLVPNGVNKNWPYDFTIFDAGSVVVQISPTADDSDPGLYEVTSNFTFVPTSGSYNGGYIVYPAAGAALASGYIRIVRRVPYTQETQIGPEGDFSPEIHERAFDKLTTQTQQLSAEIITLTDLLELSQEEYEDALEYTLSAAESTANAANSAQIALAAAASTGDVAFFDTYALADAASLPDGKVVEIFVDETRYNLRTRYVVEAGNLVFKVLMQHNLTRINPRDYGAIMDGTSHPLSERFATLVEAQALYPHAVALTDEIDWAAIQLCLNLAYSVTIPDGTAYLNRKLTKTGGVDLRGNGQAMSKLVWDAASVSVGYECTVTAQKDYAGVADLGVMTKGVTGNGIVLDFSPQGASVFSIEQRGHVKGCRVSGFTELTTYFDKAIRIVQPKNVLVEDNFCLGGWTAPDTVQTLTPTVGIEFIGTALSAVSAKIWKNQCLFFKTGIDSDKVEGIWIEGNDSQANYRALRVTNSDFIKNQVRIVNNHLGAYYRAIDIDAVQFFMIIGNEIFMSAYAGFGARTITYFKDVSGGKIIGNTFRAGGNDPTTYECLGADFVREDQLANVFEVLFVGNQFYDVKNGVRHDPTNSTVISIDASNIFHNMTGTRQNMNGNVQAQHRRVMGDGTLALPSGWTGTLCLEKRAMAALALNRTEGDGQVATFHAAYAAAAGNITVGGGGTTTAFNTSSDETLKNDLGEFPAEQAKEIMKLMRFHEFTWKATGKADQGVFAQELYKVYPKAVTPGGEDEEGNYIAWSVDYSLLMPVVARCVQIVFDEQENLDKRLSKLELA